MINSSHVRSGGAHTVYLNTAELLKFAGHEIIFFSMHSENEISCPESIFFAKDRLSMNYLSYICNYIYNKNAAISLNKLIIQTKPDIAHIHLFWGFLTGSIIKVLKEHNIPIVHTVHDYAMICPRGTLKNEDGEICEKCSTQSYYKCFLSKCFHNSYLKSGIITAEMYFRTMYTPPTKLIDHFIFVSRFCRNKHLEMDHNFINHTSSILYNFQNVDLIKYFNGFSDSYNSYYLYYGRLSYEKGIYTLINAFRKYPSIRLKIIGDGPLRDDIINHLEQYKIQNVEYLGYKSGKELFETIKSAKYVCVPSEWFENNPMTIIESYSLGTPVIAANIGGITEIVEDCSTGFLFQSGSITSLLTVIKHSIDVSTVDYHEMKQKAHEYAHNHFDKDEHLNKLLSIYNNLLSI